MVPKWFRRSGRKLFKSLTSASTGDADAIAQFPLALLVVLAFIKRIISAPVMRRIVIHSEKLRLIEKIPSWFYQTSFYYVCLVALFVYIGETLNESIIAVTSLCIIGWSLQIIVRYFWSVYYYLFKGVDSEYVSIRHFFYCIISSVLVCASFLVLRHLYN